MYIMIDNKRHEQETRLEDILVEGGQHILLDGPGNGLQGLVGLALGVVVLHVVHGRKGGLDGDVEALVPGIVDGAADSGVEDVGFSVLVC